MPSLRLPSSISFLDNKAPLKLASVYLLISLNVRCWLCSSCQSDECLLRLCLAVRIYRSGIIRSYSSNCKEREMTQQWFNFGSGSIRSYSTWRSNCSLPLIAPLFCHQLVWRVTYLATLTKLYPNYSSKCKRIEETQ